MNNSIAAIRSMRIHPTFLLAVAALCLAPARAVWATDGADVIVGKISGTDWDPVTSGFRNPRVEGPAKWGTIDGVTSYSVGTTSCNAGDEELNWQDGSPNHPVIAQNMYRLKDGRFEQIGMAWLKHGFCALQQSLCFECDPAGFGCTDKLGVGCSDPYSATLNAGQGGMGPRSDVDAATGVFTYPYSTINQSGNALYKRLQVANDDLDPALNAGALYFAEGQYVAKDDAAAGNDDNNASYRPFVVAQLSNGGFHLTWSGDTILKDAALFAWQEADPEVVITTVDIPGDGRMLLGSRAVEVGEGVWRYEYALYNLNSDRSAQSFSVPLPSGVQAAETGFHDVNYHSAELYSSVDWVAVNNPCRVRWSCESYQTNKNANALRWSTLYNFRFEAPLPPPGRPGLASITLFKAGTPGSVEAEAIVPMIDCNRNCLADDDEPQAADINLFVQHLLTGGAGSEIFCLMDVNEDGVIDGGDIQPFIGRMLGG